MKRMLVSLSFILMAGCGRGGDIVGADAPDDTVQTRGSLATEGGTVFFADPGGGLADNGQRDIGIDLGPEASPQIYWHAMRVGPKFDGPGFHAYFGRRILGDPAGSSFTYAADVSASAGDPVFQTGDIHVTRVPGSSGAMQQLFMSYGCTVLPPRGQFPRFDTCVARSTNAGATWSSYKRHALGGDQGHEPTIKCNHTTECMLQISSGFPELLPPGATTRQYVSLWNGIDWTDPVLLWDGFAAHGAFAPIGASKYAYARTDDGYIEVPPSNSAAVQRGTLTVSPNRTVTTTTVDNLGAAYPVTFAMYSTAASGAQPITNLDNGAFAMTVAANGRRAAIMGGRSCIQNPNAEGFPCLGDPSQSMFTTVITRIWTEVNGNFNTLTSAVWNDSANGNHLTLPTVTHDSAAAMFYAFYTKNRPAGGPSTDPNQHEYHDLCYRRVSSTCVSGCAWSTEICPVRGIQAKMVRSDRAHGDLAQGDLEVAGAVSNGNIALIFADECTMVATSPADPSVCDLDGGACGPYDACKLKIWTSWTQP